MRRIALLALFLAAAWALPVQAQAGGASDAADGTLEDSQSALDRVLDGVGDAGEAVGEAVTGAGDAVGDAAGAVGRTFADALRLAGRSAEAAAGALAAVGLLSSQALAGGLASVARAFLSGSGSLGALAGLALALAGSAAASVAGALAQALSALFEAAWGAVGLLRPAALPTPAFAAAAATGAAATSAAALYGFLALLKKYGWVSLGGLAGFSRITGEEILNHPVRGQLFQVVRENPGIHASALARRMGVGWGTITHHLDKLEKAQLLATRKVNNQKCFFENGGRVSRHDMQVASAVRGETAGEIAAYVTIHPMTSQKSMAAALGVSPALASFHVKKLVNLGVLEKMRSGKETLLTTTESLRRILTGPEEASGGLARVEAALPMGS